MTKIFLVSQPIPASSHVGPTWGYIGNPPRMVSCWLYIALLRAPVCDTQGGRTSLPHGLMLALQSATPSPLLNIYHQGIKWGLWWSFMFLLWESNMSYLILTITQNYLSFHSISVNAVFHQAQQYKLSCLLLFQSSFTVNNCKPFILNLNTFLKQLTSRTY